MRPYTAPNCVYFIVLQRVNAELTGQTVEKIVDIARTSNNATLRTDTVQLAASRGTRMMFAKHTYVRNVYRGDAVSQVITKCQDTQHYHRNIHLCLGTWCCQSILLMASWNVTLQIAT